MSDLVVLKARVVESKVDLDEHIWPLHGGEVALSMHLEDFGKYFN